MEEPKENGKGSRGADKFAAIQNSYFRVQA
jgi:hypothetical protein